MGNIHFSCFFRYPIKKEMRMKSKRLLIAVAVILMLALVSCDFGGGGTNYRYTLPSWLHGTFAVDTATANYARAEAEVGQKYFVGIRGTSDTLYLIYRIKGTGPDSSSDEKVTYRQDEIPKKINSSYTASVVLTEGNTVSAYEITKDVDILGRDIVRFSFNPNGIGGFRILK